jgi:hypothetical protein
MTYGTTLPKTAGQKAQKPIPFLLPSEVDWSERPRSSFTGVVIEPIGLVFPVFKPASASLITPPVYWEMVTGWQESGLSLVHASELQFALLEQRYLFRRRNEVIGFLKRYRFLVSLLLEVYDRIAEYFGPSPEVVLEVVSDPEAEYRELFALVRTNLSPSAALACLERFDQEWWLDASERAQCMLNVDVEYI